MVIHVPLLLQAVARKSEKACLSSQSGRECSE